MTIILESTNREKVGKLNSLRKEGFLPAVYYGYKKDSTPIKIKKNDFLKVWKNAGESTVIKLKTDNGDIDTLVKNIDFDPVSGEPRHVDFYVFEKGHKIEISIPVELEGVSPVVKESSAILVKVMHEVKIKADPSNLPHSILIDISSLIDFDSQILAKDIKLPSGVELMENPEEVVVAVAKQKEEKEEVEAIDLSTIEVEKKGKKDEEESTDQN